MGLIEAAVLGAVQGVTEFLPISSTAHLILVRWFLGWPDHGVAFDVALHLGTLVALLLYFANDWISLTAAGIRMLQQRRTDPDSRMVLFIIAATIPGGLAGVLFEQTVEEVLRSPLVIAFAMVALAVVLFYAERRGSRQTTLDRMSWLDAISIGFAQALALIPGVSRSGVTITAGLFRGLNRDAAARFSFFLSTPLIGGAVAKKLVDIAKTGIPGVEPAPLVAGILVSGVVGYLSIDFLLRYLRTRNTNVFVLYRIALGIVVLLAYFYGL